MSHALDPWGLTFRDPAVEAAWRAEFAADTLSYVRAGVPVAAAVFALFAVTDLWLFPEQVPALWAIRFGVVVPALLTTRLALGTPRGREVMSGYTQEVLLALATLICASLLAMGLVLLPYGTDERLWHATLGFELTLVGVFGFSRLRFVYAVALGVVVTGLGMLMMQQMAVSVSPWVIGPFGVALNLTGAWATRSLELLSRRGFAERREIAAARARSEALLRNALPDRVAEQLRGAQQAAIAARYDDVTVVLADIVGFTPLCERLPPEQIASLLDALFSRFDALCTAHGAEKIKTLGDAWLAAVGVPEPHAEAPSAAARLALALHAAAAEVGGVQLRVGVGSGHAVAGVIGRTRFAYDLWGEAVASAAEMERASRPGGVRVSEAVAARLSARFVMEADAHGAWLLAERPP